MMNTRTLAELLAAPRSEVFALDLYPGDVVVVSVDGEDIAHEIDTVAPCPADDLSLGVLLWWARLVDTAATGREDVGPVAKDRPGPAFTWPATAVVEIVGAGIVR